VRTGDRSKTTVSRLSTKRMTSLLKNTALKPVALLLFITSLASSGQAQAVLSGTIHSASNPVSGMTALLINQQTDEQKTAQTDDDGRFVFPDLSPGVYRLTAGKLVFIVLLKPGKTVSLEISLPIVRISKGSGGTQTNEAPPQRLTGRDFLQPLTPEAAGYGLYSYFLFASRPTDATEKRYAAALGAFLQFIDEIRTLQSGGAKPAELNITYLPVGQEVRTGTPPEDILKFYDFARAKVLMSKLPGKLRTGGPYLVSTLQPLSNPQAPEHFLCQDLSIVPPTVVVLWFNEFTLQTARQQFWRPDTLSQFMLTLRTDIEVAADTVAPAGNWRSTVATLITGK
jgi:Carboxypeptidase regulatory-like domain